MNKIQETILSILIEISKSVPYPDPFYHERYIHHHFTKQFFKETGSTFAIDANVAELTYHPEWATHRPLRGLNGGTYAKGDDKFYRPIMNGKNPGHIDIAVGGLHSEKHGIEFKQPSGWDTKAMTYDYLKLLDPRNALIRGYSLCVLFQGEQLSEQVYGTGFMRIFNSAPKKAVEFLREVGLAPHQNPYLIITEVPQIGERRHFMYDWSRTEFRLSDLGIL